LAWPEFGPGFYALAVVAILITGISKGGFGSGIGGVAVPILSLQIAPLQAASIMLPILCLMDLVGLWAYRGKWSMAQIRIMVPGAIVGIALGAFAFGRLPANSVRLVIGLIAIGFTLNYWFGLTTRLARTGQPPGSAQGVFWSGVSGFTSTLAHAGGPPLAVYLLPQKLDKTLFVGTTVAFFTLVNYVKLIPYAWLGQFDATNVSTSLVLLPLAPLGMALGIWLHRRISDRWFYRISYTALFATGTKLVFDALAR
jgi:uncharacterized membrane protein YfcA